MGIGETTEPCKCAHAACTPTMGAAPVDPFAIGAVS